MKNLFILFFVLLLLNTPSYSQSQKAKDIIYLDFGLTLFLGAGIGINYERMLNDNVSIRTGINLGIFIIGGGSAGLSVPVTINYMTSAKNKFQAGIGGGPLFNLERKWEPQFFPAFTLCYRYQPEKKDLFIKIGVDVPANKYLSVLSLGSVR